MVNTNLLKAKIAEHGMNAGDFAKLLGVSRQSISLKMNNIREFKASEIQQAINILDIDSADTSKYFFAKDVEKMKTM